VFKVPAEGASRTIDFGVIDRPSAINCVLERIKRTPTSKEIPDGPNIKGNGDEKLHLYIRLIGFIHGYDISLCRTDSRS
jgi:hypothetical protein